MSKALMEIFKMTSRLGIKPKDVIGVGGDIVRMGKSLFNTKVNPKLLDYVNKKGEIPGKILEDIKIHMRSMKNASDNQIELFRLNLKDIFNAKFPPPVTSIKKPATSVKKLETMPKYKETPGEWARAQTFGTKEYYLNELKNAYPKNYRNLTGKETKEELKEIIYRLDTEGIPFNDGGIAKLNAQLNQLPEYYLPMAKGGLPKGPAGITSLNGWGSKDDSQNKAGADISPSMDKNPNDPGWGGGDGPKGPPSVINKPPKGPTPEERRLKQLADQSRKYRDYYKKFKGDTKKKTEYLSRLLKNDPLYQTYVDKGLLDWNNIKGFDLDRRKTAEEIEEAKQSSWGYTRPWTDDDSLYIRDLEKFDPTWTPGWTGDSKQEKLNKRIAKTIGHEARHQVLGEGEIPPARLQGVNLWTGDPYSQDVETKLTMDADSPYQTFIDDLDSPSYNWAQHAFGYKPHVASHELLTRMGDFQAYNDPRVYEDIYETIHKDMPRHLTSDIANKFYDASEQFVKDAKARNVGEKYENIDPVMVDSYANFLAEEEGAPPRSELVRLLKQEAEEMGTKEFMDILKEQYEDNYKYAKGGIANHFRSK